MVAVYFIINAFLVGSIDVLMVWQIVDILMLVGLALGLAFNYAYKREAGSGKRERALPAKPLLVDIWKPTWPSM